MFPFMVAFCKLFLTVCFSSLLTHEVVTINKKVYIFVMHNFSFISKFLSALYIDIYCSLSILYIILLLCGVSFASYCKLLL